MKKRQRKKPNKNRAIFWVVVILLIGALITGYRLWFCLIDVSPEFYYLVISKDGSLLKLLNGEKLQLHPSDLIKIEDISTNVCFNQGIRLTARGIDVNALLYEEIQMSDLLPDQRTLDKYNFKLNVKYYNRNIGYIDIAVEPYVEDWLEKVDRTIDSDRKVLLLEQAKALGIKDKRIDERLISAYISLEKWKEAALIMEDMVKEKSDPAILNDLLKVYEDMKSNENIISVLKRLEELDPNNIDLRMRLAEKFEQQERYGDAISEYEEILDLVKREDRLPVYKHLGFLYTKTNQEDKAIDSYLNAADLDEKDVNIYYNLASLYEKQGKKDRADHFLSKALELDSGEMGGRLLLAENLINKGEMDEAEKYLNEVLGKKPKSLEALSLLIKIAEKREDRGLLKDTYTKILAVDPDNITVIYNLGILEYEGDNLSEAEPYLIKYLKNSPKDLNVHIILFDIYKRLNRETEAYDEAMTIIKLDPKATAYYHYLFESLNKSGRYKEIINIMGHGLESNPRNSDLRKYLVLAYLQTGKDDLALDQLRELLKITPDDVSILLQYARLNEKKGNLEEALKAYKRIVDVSPGNEEAEDAYMRLRLEVLQSE